MDPVFLACSGVFTCSGCSGVFWCVLDFLLGLMGCLLPFREGDDGSAGKGQEVGVVPTLIIEAEPLLSSYSMPVTV